MNTDDLLAQNIIESLNASNLPEEKKQQLLDALTDLILQRATNRFANSLAEGDNVDEALASRTAEMEEILRNEVATVKQELIQSLI